MVDVLGRERLDAEMDEYMLMWSVFTVEERNILVQKYLDTYEQLMGGKPSPQRLSELADFILAEELANPHPDKVTREEYPILTSKQLLRRQKKTVLSDKEDTTDFLNTKYNGTADVTTHVHRKVTTEKRV